MTRSTEWWLALLYDWHNSVRLERQAADVAFWCSTVGRGRDVAVLGAGTGRVASQLARTDNAVIAVDRDHHRLARIDEPAVRRVCADFASLPLHGCVDHVVFPYSTLQLVPPTDVARVLDAARALLAPLSRLWVDVSDGFAGRADKPWHEVLAGECPEAAASVVELQRGTRRADHYLLEARWVVQGAILAESEERWFFHPDPDVRAAAAAASLKVLGLRHGYGSASSVHRRIYELAAVTHLASRISPVRSGVSRARSAISTSGRS